MKKIITIKREIEVCDKCHEELPSWGSVNWENKKYHVNCFKEIKENEK